MHVEKILPVPSKEFSTPERFVGSLSSLVSGLIQLENQWQGQILSDGLPDGIGEINETTGFLGFSPDFQLMSQDEKLSQFEKFRHDYYEQSRLETFSLDEQQLFYQILSLFELKHGFGSQAILLEELKKPHKGKLIGCLGALSVGKSTIVQKLKEDLEVTNERSIKEILEPYVLSPFRALSQEDLSFMLRSQTFFLLANIMADIRARLDDGISISHSSPLNDILVWARLYFETGRFSEEEYKIYQELVDLLKPIIPKPDLLVVLQPETVENLYQGKEKRRKHEMKTRATEESFTAQDLAKQVEIVDELIRDIPIEWDVPILPLVVNSLKIREDPYIGYDVIYQIRGKLGILGELIHPSADEVVEGIVVRLVSSDERLVINVNSPTMFTQKTAVLCKLPERIGGRDKVTVFQPKAALRFVGQEKQLINRDGLTLEAITIPDNDLQSTIDYVSNNQIDPNKKPFIFIDEIMLFHKTPVESAVGLLEKLRMLGFHVIVDGIDYTFQGKPFTFMHELLKQTKTNPNWIQFMMHTRCRYCDSPARVTRRWKVDPKTGKRIRIARFGETSFKAGDSEYEPVCGDATKGHESCSHQPRDFIRPELPV